MKWHETEHYQERLSKLRESWEPCLVGHERRVIILTATRLIAEMLVHGRLETQDAVLEALPGAVRSIMIEILETTKPKGTWK